MTGEVVIPGISGTDFKMEYDSSQMPDSDAVWWLRGKWALVVNNQFVRAKFEYTVGAGNIIAGRRGEMKIFAEKLMKELESQLKGQWDAMLVTVQETFASQSS